MTHIAILWATWAVWIEIINCLFDKKIQVTSLRLLASKRSAWKLLQTPFWWIQIEEVTKDSFKWVDFAFFSAGWNISKAWADIAIESWAIVIDNTSAFRYDDNVPLVVPEINPDAIWNAKLIANPNCTTAIAAVAMYPIHQKYIIKKAIISTYQATSWAWAKWMEELKKSTKDYLEWNTVENHEFVHPIAFNLIPHIDSFQDNWYTREEMKVVWETRKIFWDDSIDISVTAIRIPTLRAHSESIVLETQDEIDPEEVKKLMSLAPWVELVDDIDKNLYPMPLTASNKYDVEIWRIRQNLVFWKKWIEFFVAWDQLLKWAALNAVQIMEEILKR